MKLERFTGLGELDSFSAQNVREGTVNGVPYIDKRAKIFPAGVHRGKPYDEKYLDDLVANFSAPTADDEWSVPVQLDHDMSADKTRGSVRTLERVGKTLMGWLRFTGLKSIEKVKAGNYRRLSPSINYAARRLVEVSVTPDPFFNDVTLFHNDHKEEDMKDQSPEAGAPPTPPEAPKPANTADIASLQALQEQFRKTNEALAERDARIAALEASQEQFRKEQVKTQRMATVATFRASGKITSHQYEPACKLVESFSDDQVKLFEAFMGTSPTLVSTDVLGHQDSTRPGEEVPPEQFEAKCKALAEKYFKQGDAA